MFYCDKCQMISETETCSCCGKPKLREPMENDTVYLMTKEAMWSGGIEDILKENGIPCLKQGDTGSGDYFTDRKL